MAADSVVWLRKASRSCAQRMCLMRQAREDSNELVAIVRERGPGGVPERKATVRGPAP